MGDPGKEIVGGVMYVEVRSEGYRHSYPIATFPQNGLINFDGVLDI